MRSRERQDHLSSSFTDLMSSLVVIFILLFLAFVHDRADLLGYLLAARAQILCTFARAIGNILAGFTPALGRVEDARKGTHAESG